MDKIPMSEARARFTELLQRAEAGEAFEITTRGHETTSILMGKEELLRLGGKVTVPGRGEVKPPDEPDVRREGDAVFTKDDGLSPPARKLAEWYTKARER